MSARHHKADCSCRMCVRLLEQGVAPKSGDRGTLSAKVLRKSLRLLEAELKNPKLTSAQRVAIAGKLQKIGNDLARLERQDRQQASVPQAPELPRIVVQKFRSIYTKRDVYWAHLENDERELARADSEQEARWLAREKWLAEQIGSAAPVAENQSPESSDQEHCVEVDKLLAEENMQSSVQKMNVEAPHPQDPPEPVVSSPTSAPALSAEAEAEAFMAEHAAYWPVKENFELMLRWLVANKCKNSSSPWTKQFVLSVSTLNAKADYLFRQGVFTKATLAEAYDALNGLGLLELRPAEQLKPQPEPPQSASAICSEPPQHVNDILDEKVKASLEELDGYVLDEKLMATLDYTQREKLRRLATDAAAARYRANYSPLDMPDPTAQFMPAPVPRDCDPLAVRQLQSAELSAAEKIQARQDHESWREERDVVDYWRRQTYSQSGIGEGRPTSATRYAQQIWENLFDLEAEMKNKPPIEEVTNPPWLGRRKPK